MSGSGNGHVKFLSPAEILLGAAVVLEERGECDAANDMLERARELEKAGGGEQSLGWLMGQGFNPVEMYRDALQNAQVLAGAMPPPAADDALIKAIRSGASPTGIPHRISDALWTVGAYTGIKDPHAATAVTFYFLKQLARHPIIRAIIHTRINKARPYAANYVPLNSRQAGWCLKLRESTAEMTPEARRVVEEIKMVLESGGYRVLPDGTRSVHPITGEWGVWDGKGMEKALGLSRAVPILIDDSLSMDWALWRMEAGTKSDRFPIAYWSPVASENYRLTLPHKYVPQIRKELPQVSYVEIGIAQGTQHQVVREFAWNEIGRFVRNEQLGRWNAGYGRSEIETLLDLLAYLIANLKFHGEWFTSSHIPPGIVSVVGNLSAVGTQALSAIRQEVAHTVGGIGAFWKLIWLFLAQGSAINFTPLRPGLMSAEAQWAQQFLLLLVNLICGVYCIDPEEIGFKSFGAMGRSLIGNERNPEVIFEHSQDKGFRPMMASLAAAINENIIWRLSEDFEFVWVNLNPRDPMEELQEAQLKLQQGWTLNEIHAEQDRPTVRHPVDTQLFNDIAAKVPRQNFPTAEDWRMQVEMFYEAECLKRRYREIWSAAWDAPVGNPAAMQVWLMEREMLRQAMMPPPERAAGQKDEQEKGEAEGEAEKSLRVVEVVVSRKEV